MVRAYQKAWLLQHHAARAMDSKRTGFIVLKQIMHYLNDMYRLPSAKMDYVMCYFQPANKFPDRVFGGFARSLKNPRGCSMDLFAYLPYTGLSLG
ncbi:MAG: pilus assembly protein PilZ, partial [Deltaproteobacteria bacterium]|nr:pilus assembly protein PilZ [Deltaproteobacteria bacterium]